MQFAETEIVDIVRTIWASILELEVELDEQAAPVNRQGRWTASVQITGEWTGAVVLESSAEFARQAAAIFLDTPEDALEPADIQDALAELTNMIGGNLKSILPAPSFLSLPCVTDGDDYAFVVPKAILRTQLGFESRGNPFGVVVFEAPAESATHEAEQGTARNGFASH